MDKQVFIIGAGPGAREHLTLCAHEAIHSAGLLIGAPRLLEGFADLPCEKYPCVRPGDIARRVAESETSAIAVLLSGDVGFHSGAKLLLEQLAGREVKVLPGIGSLQYFCARLHTPWEDVHTVSAHGKAVNIAAHAAAHPRSFFLTGGEATAQSLCAALTDCGMGDARVSVGSRLSYPDEAIFTGTAAEAARRSFDPLSVVLVERASLPRWPYATGGIPDHLFIRGEVPMTKAEVRAVSLAKLGLRRGDTVYDVGAGTGSVSVEAACCAPDGRVYAIEHNPQALALIEKNRAAFGAFNIEVIAGKAPDALAGLPAPDAVFVGGSGGNLAEILQTVAQKNPAVRVVVNAITLQTLTAAMSGLEALGFTGIEAVQIGVSRLGGQGGSRMLLAQNPVFIISGQGAGR